MSLIKKIMTISSFFLVSVSLSSCSLVGDYFQYSRKDNDDDRFKITWNDGNGKEIYSELVSKGTVPEFKSELPPTKYSNTQFTYKFNNTWDPEIEPAIRDITYTAQFDNILNKYRVNFFDDDHLLELTDYYYGDMPAYSGVIPPVKESDDPDSLFETRFVGWEPEISKVTDHISYYTVYKRLPKNEIFKVTFEFNNGAEPITKEYNAGQVIEYPDPPSKIGYVFTNWDYQVTQMPDFDLTIRAMYSLSSPGEYSWSSESNYSINNGKDYTSFTPYNNLLSSNRLVVNANNEVTSYSSSNTSILILPSTIKGIRSISNANMKELFVNSTSSHNFTFYAGCMTNCGIRRLFIEGDGKVVFPGHDSNIDKGYFNKSNACFNSADFKEVYFHNKQEVLNTAVLSNQNNSLSKLVLPSSLKQLYYYSFFNTGKSSSSSQYIFATNMSIEEQELPSSLTDFYYINTSSPFISYTTFIYNGNQDSWDNVRKYSYLYNSSSTVKGQSSLPSDVIVTFK